ncbi:hypothetical protein HDU96_003714, partial [Phlyctochytrium bullatum]
MEIEKKKIILFNCSSFVDFSSGDSILPTRITCYCRHHNERVGFCIYFVARDHTGSIISTGISPPILITDDHKSTKPKSQKRQREEDEVPPVPRAAGNGAPAEDLHMDGYRSAHQMPMQLHAFSHHPSPPHSNADQMAAQLLSPPASSIFIKEETASVASTPFMLSENGPLATPGNGPITTPTLTNGSFSSGTDHANGFINPVSAQLFAQMDLSSEPDAYLNLSPPPAKRHQSFVENGVGAGLPDDEASALVAMAFTEQLLASLEGPVVQSPAPTAHPTPSIGRIIPFEGPLHGGTDITILGSGFYDGLTPLFGDVPATKVQLWGTSTIICILPPSSIPGPVPVTFKEHPAMSIMQPVSEVAIFTYKDESERALMELALQVVGLRMTGKLEDARNVAMRIVTDTAQEGGNGNSGANTGNNGERRRSAGVPGSFTRLLAELAGRRLGTRAELELCLMDAILSAEQMDGTVRFRDALDVKTRTGHTLLHLACLAGMVTFAKLLVASGADVDARDVNGYTPLHYAAISGERSLAVDLLENGASPFLTSVQGISALGLAKKAGLSVIYEAIKGYVIEPWTYEEEGNYSEDEENECDGEEEDVSAT